MHIDHKQFLELITEAGGINAEKAEKQLLELIADIKQSLEEGGAYEIEGFGIFSSLGNRIMFIPSKELETEINFKYVGMEPIELDEPSPAFDDPFDELDQEDETTSKSPSIDQRFAGLIDDLSEPGEEAEETPGPDEWGVEAHKEDESADRLFASLMGEDYEAPVKEEEGIDASESDDFDEFGDIFAELEETDDSADLGEEVASFMEQESEESPESSVDDELEELFTEEPVDDLEDDIFGDESEEETEASELTDTQEEDTDEVTPVPEPEATEEPVDEAEPEEESTEETPSEEEEPELETADDFDDPFLALEDEQVDESILRLEELDDTEIVPVIRNISTEVTEEEAEQKKEKKEKEKAKKEKKKKEKPKKVKSEPQPAPAWMWVLLIVVVSGGGVAGLGYFNIISIPFISPQTASTTSQPIQTPPPAPVTQPEAQVTEAQNEGTQEPATPADEPVTEEQIPVTQVPVQEVTDNPVSANAEQYGLTGMLSDAGDDGYTIILYTLSNQQNAINERQKLIDNGYRGFLTPVSSERYGTLFRVSVGQFATLYDAAVAAEEIESLLPDNYIIKKIN